MKEYVQKLNKKNTLASGIEYRPSTNSLIPTKGISESTQDAQKINMNS